MVATAVQSMCYALIVVKTDWQKVADEAVERINREAAELNERVTAVNDSNDYISKVD